MATYAQYINGLYITMYGRVADSNGYNYWLGTLGVTAAQAATTTISTATEQSLADAFVSTQSTYFNTQYGGLSDTNFILALYNNLGGNTTGVTGANLSYWQAQLTALGSRSALTAAFVDAFVNYNGTDTAGLARQAAFMNSIAVSQAWISASASNSFMNATSTTGAAFTAEQNILVGLNNTTGALAVALGQISTAVSTQSLTGVTGNPTNNASTYTLTTGVDTIAGTGVETVKADLTPYNYNGNGPTLNVGDSIANVASLAITDQYGQGNDVIPSGVTLSNIANITLTTQGVAGGSNSSSGAAFDVSGVSGLKTVAVTSYGGNYDYNSTTPTENGDWVKAASTVAISVTQNNTGAVGVWTQGGSSVTVVDNGTPYLASSSSNALNDFGIGVNVGSIAVPAANPVGAVSVTENGNNPVYVFGGSAAAGSAAVTISTAGYGQVLVGDWAVDTVTPSANVTSGDIMVTDTDTRNIPAGPIGVFGGQNVTVNSTPQLGGPVVVGTLASGGGNTSLSANAATNQQFVATGNVSVTNEAAFANVVNYKTGQTSGVAGATVVTGGANITVTTDTGAVAVGAPILVQYTGAPAGTTGAAGLTGSISTASGQLDISNASTYLGKLFNGTTAILGPDGKSPLVSGAVSITDTANDTTGHNYNGVYVFGGVGTTTTPAVTINNAGTTVQVGADANTPLALTGNLVAAPTGAVVVNDGTSAAAPNQAFDNIANTVEHDVTVVGATVTNVTVATNAGSVFIGDDALTPVTNLAEPTGAIQITDTAGAVNPNTTTNVGVGNSTTDEVDVYGGTTVNINATDGDVIVGDSGAAANTLPTGTVNVTVAAIETGTTPGNTIEVYGGNGITISATGAASITAGSAAAPVAGAVVITDSFDTNAFTTYNTGALENTNGDVITVVGGAAVTIKESASSGAVSVGDVAIQMNAAGTGLANAGDYASGAVSVVNASGSGNSTVFGSGGATVNVYGSSSVSIVGGGDVNVTDEATTLATAGSTAGKPIAASTLSSVVVDGSTGGVSVTTNVSALNLSVFDNSTASQAVDVTDANAHTLALTVGNETKGLTLTDNKATSISVADSATLVGNAAASSAKGVVTLDSTSATTLAVSNAAAQSLNVSGLTALKTVTATNTGALKLVDINPGVTSFNGVGGTGNQTVGLSQNAVGTGVTIKGGSGSNTLIADYNAIVGDVALGTTTSGFTTLQVGNGEESASSGLAYVPAHGVKAQVDTVTFTHAATAVGTFTETIGGTAVNITTAAGETTAQLAAALAGAVTSTGLAGYSVSYSGGNNFFTLTGPSTATTFTSFTDVLAANATGVVGGVAPAAGQNKYVGDASYDATGFKALVVGSSPGDVSFTNVGAGVGLTLTNAVAGVVNYVLASTSGSTSLPLTVGVDGAAGVGTVGLTDIVLTSGVQSISVASLGEVKDATGAVQTNVITIGDTAATSVTITGDQALTLTLKTDANAALNEQLADGSSVTKIDASGSNGAVDVTGVALAYDATHTILGGSGKLTAAGGIETLDIDSIAVGSGGGKITLGAGGSWNDTIVTTVNAGPPATTTTGAFDVGSESIDLTKATAKSSSIVINDNTVANAEGGIGAGGVTAFKATASAAADQLSYQTGATLNPKLQLVNVSAISVVGNVLSASNMANALDPSGKLASDIVNLTYTASNGVISFGATGGHTLSSFTTSELIAAAEIITAAEGANVVASFVSGGSTYVVASGEHNYLAADLGVMTGVNTPNQNDASIVELIGQTTDTGFSSFENLAGSSTSAGLGASGAIVANVEQQVLDNDGVTGSSKTYDDTGYSSDTLTAANTASQTTTFKNLAPAAELYVNGGGNEVGNVTITQTGGASANSLIVDFANTHTDTIDTLNVTNDWALQFNSEIAAGAVKSLVDTSGTLTNIYVTGLGVTLDAVSATALTSIDAHTATGALVLGDTTALTQTGLSILGALGGDTIYANGSSNTISIGSNQNAVTGSVTVHAAGGGDTISVTNMHGSGSLILAGGAGDTISVDTGTNNIGTGVSSVTGALAAGDTVNLADGGSDAVYLGANSLVNLVTNSVTQKTFGTTVTSADVYVKSDLTGVTSSGIVAGTATSAGTGLETINGAADATIGANATLTIHFDNVNKSGSSLTEVWAGGGIANAQVNVQSATSLANAIDIAAAQGVIYDAQHGAANTTVVAGQAELNGSTGMLDWFQYGGNTFIVEAINNSSTSGAGGAATHTALTTHDMVVELTGLVNLGASAHVSIA